VQETINKQKSTVKVAQEKQKKLEDELKRKEEKELMQ